MAFALSELTKATPIELPEPPSANRWWRRAGTRMHLSNEARAYRRVVELTLMAARIRTIPAPDPVVVYVTWYRGRRSGDLDKRLGVLLDAMQGTAYESDSQIVRIEAHRADDPGNPRVLVSVTRATEVAA